MAINNAYKKKSNFLLSILAVFIVGGLCFTGANSLYGNDSIKHIFKHLIMA